MFYTILPQLPLINTNFKRIARFAPLIGLIIGISQAILLVILSKFNWPYEALPFIYIAIEIWVTGGLHFDGLMDTADGVSAGPTRCLEAMKDSRIGASGILILIINIFLQIAALFKLKLFYLFALPISGFWSRYSQIWAIDRYIYIQKEGFSRFHKSNWKGLFRESIPSLICLTLITVTLLTLQINYLLKIHFIIATLVSLFPAILVPRILNKLIGGHTGDSYGASVVLVQTFILILLAIILPAN